MHKQFKTGLFSGLLALAQPAAGLAQTLEPDTAVIAWTGGSFFMSLLGGVLLALAFQAVLTFLSAAAGITLIGNIEKKARQSGRSEAVGDDDGEGPGAAVKITAAAGIWTLVTASLSLFFASFLAVRMSPAPVNAAGVTMGLVIWAAFFLAVTWMEARSAGWMTGGIAGAAMQGLRASAGAARDLFAKSEERKVRDAAHNTAAAIREELTRTLYHSRLGDTIQEYFSRLNPPERDWNHIKSRLEDFLNDIQIREELQKSGEGTERRWILEAAGRHPHISRGEAEKISGIAGKIRSAAQTEGSRTDKVLAAVDKLTPGSEESSRQLRRKIEDYLRSTGIEELSPESIRADLERILYQPASIPEVIRNRMNSMDHSTLVALVSNIRHVPEEKAETLASKVESALSSLQSKFGQAASKVEGGEGNGNGGAGLKAKVDEKLDAFFSSLGRPEFDYDSLKEDFRKMLHDPKASPEILRNRFQQYDRESLITLMSSNSRISRESAEEIVARFQDARDSVIEKAHEMEREVRTRVAQAKNEALHQAEKLRRTAALAAWWLFATAVVSGAASAIGGALAV